MSVNSTHRTTGHAVYLPPVTEKRKAGPAGAVARDGANTSTTGAGQDPVAGGERPGQSGGGGAGFGARTYSANADANGVAGTVAGAAAASAMKALVDGAKKGVADFLGGPRNANQLSMALTGKSYAGLSKTERNGLKQLQESLRDGVLSQFKVGDVRADNGAQSAKIRHLLYEAVGAQAASYGIDVKPGPSGQSTSAALASMVDAGAAGGAEGAGTGGPDTRFEVRPHASIRDLQDQEPEEITGVRKNFVSDEVDVELVSEASDVATWLAKVYGDPSNKNTLSVALTDVPYDQLHVKGQEAINTLQKQIKRGDLLEINIRYAPTVDEKLIEKAPDKDDKIGNGALKNVLPENSRGAIVFDESRPAASNSVFRYATILINSRGELNDGARGSVLTQLMGESIGQRFDELTKDMPEQGLKSPLQKGQVGARVAAASTESGSKEDSPEVKKNRKKEADANTGDVIVDGKKSTGFLWRFQDDAYGKKRTGSNPERAENSREARGSTVSRQEVRALEAIDEVEKLTIDIETSAGNIATQSAVRSDDPNNAISFVESQIDGIHDEFNKANDNIGEITKRLKIAEANGATPKEMKALVENAGKAIEKLYASIDIKPLFDSVVRAFEVDSSKKDAKDAEEQLEMIGLIIGTIGICVAIPFSFGMGLPMAAAAGGALVKKAPEVGAAVGKGVTKVPARSGPRNSGAAGSGAAGSGREVSRGSGGARSGSRSSGAAGSGAAGSGREVSRGSGGARSDPRSSGAAGSGAAGSGREVSRGSGGARSGPRSSGAAGSGAAGSGREVSKGSGGARSGPRSLGEEGSGAAGSGRVIWRGSGRARSGPQSPGAAGSGAARGPGATKSDAGAGTGAGAGAGAGTGTGAGTGATGTGAGTGARAGAGSEAGSSVAKPAKGGPFVRPDGKIAVVGRMTPNQVAGAQGGAGIFGGAIPVGYTATGWLSRRVSPATVARNDAQGNLGPKSAATTNLKEFMKFAEPRGLDVVDMRAKTLEPAADRIEDSAKAFAMVDTGVRVLNGESFADISPRLKESGVSYFAEGLDSKYLFAMNSRGDGVVKLGANKIDTLKIESMNFGDVDYVPRVRPGNIVLDRAEKLDPNSGKYPYPKNSETKEISETRRAWMAVYDAEHRYGAGGAHMNEDDKVDPIRIRRAQYEVTVAELEEGKKGKKGVAVEDLTFALPFDKKSATPKHMKESLEKVIVAYENYQESLAAHQAMPDKTSADKEAKTKAADRPGGLNEKAKSLESAERVHFGSSVFKKSPGKVYDDKKYSFDYAPGRDIAGAESGGAGGEDYFNPVSSAFPFQRGTDEINKRFHKPRITFGNIKGDHDKIRADAR